MIPATRATASTSPLGTFPSAIARSVAGASEINPSATASRKLTGLADTSTIWARPPSSTWLNFAGFSRVLFIAPSLSQVRQRLALPANFLHRIAHLLRRHELAFFDVDGAAGLRTCQKQIRLPRQKRRHLEHIHHLGRLFHLRGLVHIGQYRHTLLVLDALQDYQPLFQ